MGMKFKRVLKKAKKKDNEIKENYDIDEAFNNTRKAIKMDKEGKKLKADLSDDDEFLKNKNIRRFEDGLPVYTEEELKLQNRFKTNHTKLCPFDCDCCF